MGQNAWDIGLILGGVTIVVLGLFAAVYGVSLIGDFMGFNSEFWTDLSLMLRVLLVIGILVLVAVAALLWSELRSGW